MTKLPTLYSHSQTGKPLVWNICVHDDWYEVSYGELDGKQQTNRTYCTGKNEGRANATSPFEQALKEAQALHTKQQERKNYTTSLDIAPPFKPVLLRDYRKVGHQVDWSNRIYQQPKYDGMRITQQNHQFISRTGVVIDLPHIPKLPVNVDGEFYIHGQPLNQILSAVKKPNELTPFVQLHIFDIVDPTKTFEERLDILNNLGVDHPSIVIVPTERIALDDLDEVHDEAVKQGYEGIVLKLGHGVYEPNTRSKYMFKYKKFQDDEFLITGVTADKREQAVLTCLTHDGKPFSVRCMGTDAYRANQLSCSEQFIGKFLTVKFQYYSEYGIPIFPVGVAIRGG